MKTYDLQIGEDQIKSLESACKILFLTVKLGEIKHGRLHATIKCSKHKELTLDRLFWLGRHFENQEQYRLDVLCGAKIAFKD